MDFNTMGSTKSKQSHTVNKPVTSEAVNKESMNTKVADQTTATSNNQSSTNYSDDKMVKAIIVGAGHRGFGYACYALARPNEMVVVGVAEPDERTSKRMQTAFDLSDEQMFKSWEQIAEVDKMADIAIIATQDQLHKAPAIALADKGYHILLEKPMAVSYEDCKEIVEAVKRNNVLFSVCHVLRYYPQYKMIKKLIEEGTIGQVCQISHTEPVGFWHFAHSYVRGNWRKEEESSSSLLAKCCHDLDLITYWMGDNKCIKLSSFGSLMHFTRENKPQDATDNCLTCPLKNDCAYSAKKIYLDETIEGAFSWPVSVVCNTGDIEDLKQALHTGPYGKCVYNCDNNVMSNQVVNMQFSDGAIANLNMVALTRRVCARETHISGTKGEITCDFSGPVNVYDFSSMQTTKHQPEFESIPFGLNGHNGADYHLIKTFIDAVVAKDQKLILAGPDETLYSHYLVFAAEKARKESCVVEVKQ